MSAVLELGVDTFGDIYPDENGAPLPAAQVIRDVVEQAVLCDQCGIDFIGLGEHHRPDFALSSPEIVMSAIAARTQRIHVGTAVTVLSSDDPVRLFQRFSTLNAIANGRAEVILGRGSFIESFPLFGFNLKDYEILFEERLDLFAQLLKGGPVSWRGQTRTGLENQKVYPPLENGQLTAWIGVGGSPESVVRAAHYGFPLMLAIIGGAPQRFRPYVDLFHQALEKSGKPQLPVGLHSHGYIGKSDQAARDEYWPDYKKMRDKIGAERGWGAFTTNEFEREISHGSLYVGGPETVARKIATVAKQLGLSRFDLKYSAGPLPHGKIMNCIELYGAKVIPLVREMLAEG
ncbi:MAG: LLM class flavin-dependent oxidoreductase [Alphaproteobacteria bacterium]|nr:LLM class flavin-dependent oxidoreductase [Alphaproteobacteria bacterium]